MHDYHDALPGFDPAQILHDGCGECETRGQTVSHAIAKLDTNNFARAWARAAQWNLEGLANVSNAESALLNTLWSVQLQFEHRGIQIGELPGSTVTFAPFGGTS